ncbi:MAG TPA: tRNA (adenosine(37)-N6)-threonylcarbamoyltransferase complex dimerization subunit type 1 TsaB [Micromonosporaceae bacterium]
MLVLVVDTSTPAVTAALAQVDSRPAAGAEIKVAAQLRTVDARAHGERLAPAIDGVLAQAGASVRDLSAIVAGIGPGPFTGLRVGLVTAAVMAQTLAIPTYGVCSLDGIGAATTGVSLAATDARRHEVYWAVYVDGVRVSSPAVNRPADLTELLADVGLAPQAMAGDGAHRYAQVLGLALIDQPRYPEPAELVRLAASRILDGEPADPLTPLYLRRPDAAEPGAPKVVSQ